MVKRTFVVMIALSILSLVASAGAAVAAGKSEATIDASLLYATEPRGGFGSTVGIGVGALVDISGNMHMSRKDMKLGVRGDIAYFDWDSNYYGTDVSYTRLALFGGPRLTFGKLGGGVSVAPYLEGGLELTFNDVDVFVPGIGKRSSSETNLGLAGGGGIDFILAPNLKLGVNGRLHLVDDDILTLGLTLGMMF